MNRSTWKCLLVGAAVAVALSFAAPQADAHWWGCCQPVSYGCGYTPCCYTSCYSPCYTVGCYSSCGYDCGGGYWGWRPGPIRRLLLGSCKWYPGGYCGGYCGSCVGGCGAVTSYNSCCGVGTFDLAPANQPNQAPTPAKKPAAPTEPTPRLLRRH